MKFLAALTLLFNPTIPGLGIAALWIWVYIRIKRDPFWNRRGLHRTAPIVVSTDR